MKGNSNLEKELVDFIMNNKDDFYRLAYGYVKNSNDAIDILQDSIQKAISSKNNLKKEQSLKSWFYRIVINTSLDFLRKQKRLVVVDEETIQSYSSGINDHYTNIDLERSLEALPPKYKSVIILRYFEDLKIEEVAEILKESPNTIKTRLYKALELLRIKMN
ncbi:RNA polymerase sigma factor [Gottfriedia solisilvae]|uniref:RNA polymerase sigma factor SigV n=1 Tax=Gottfriedia solisilvae TaxID=1516104 RepID=A0A8J3F046_9BACI|nr:RNA polymerase sigma factor [Gottfriedia solisilvae]GGI17615.1 RNA polymerase sigma factor SigV [Gottfriedia solisilvae]